MMNALRSLSSGTCVASARPSSSGEAAPSAARFTRIFPSGPMRRIRPSSMRIHCPY